MESKDVLILWDRNFFDGQKRLLPNSKKLYTQIHNIPNNYDSWSLVLEFEETPRIQGYKTKARTHFLVEEAPHNILKEGYKFDFLDGQNKVGICEIINYESICISEIQTRIDLIESEKREFRNFINSIKVSNLKYRTEELNKLTKYINDYPYIYNLVLKLDSDVAIEYLNKYFLKLPIENNVVYHSNLPFFIFNLKNEIGESKFKEYINSLSSEVVNNEIFKNAMDEIM